MNTWHPRIACPEASAGYVQFTKRLHSILYDLQDDRCFEEFTWH